MITTLSIQNYALIDTLSIKLKEGLSIITGETGAGKSILLGALGLVLGNRADSNALKDTSKKCVVEVEVDVLNYQLESFFKKNDLDFEAKTILRREILPSGKSRAFVNDSPVNLSVLSVLKTKLIDIHSQHQTMALSDGQFQFHILDVLSKNEKKVASYQRGLELYKIQVKELELLKEGQENAQKEYDYNVHLLEELQDANLGVGEQEEIEQKLEKLNNSEEIKQSISESIQLSTAEDRGLQIMLHTLENRMQNIASFSKEYQDLATRISSIKLELDDIIVALENADENLDFNPNELEELNDKLQLIYQLQKKHQVSSIEELHQILEELAKKVDQVQNADEHLLKKENAIQEIEEKLNGLSKSISEKRIAVIPKLSKKLETLLADVGMPQARFKIEIEPSKTFLSNGKDALSFLFSANKGGNFGELKKVASGGELSRIMLAVKKVLSDNSKLPTIIFDEIDTGVSGEVSNKMAAIMKEMSINMQVITISHLPQVAAKGNTHYKVYKEEIGGVTTTNLKELSKEERILEIAEMLSGKNISDSALTHAKELLNN